MKAAIEARAVTCRTRAGVITVRDISLTVGQGELVAIIGSAGSGKATLLDALSGRCTPTSGTVRRPPGQRVGYVPVGDSLPLVLPLARALRYSAALRGAGDFRRRPGGRSSGDNSDPVARALDQVALTSAAAALVGTLNPGERKCAEIAAELLACPAALFLDEPATALDPAQATQVLRLLRVLSNTGLTVLLTTNSSLVAARCDKVALLASGGHLAFFGTPAAARGYFGADSLEEIYERLSGIGDPAAAWSRRFFYFSAAAAVCAPVPTTPRAPGPTLLIPDQAGPHSAGRPAPLFDQDPEDWTEPDPGYRSDQHSAGERSPDDPPCDLGPEPERTAGPQGGTSAGPGLLPDLRQRARPSAPLKSASQLPVLVRRNAEVFARARPQQFVIAAVPLAILVVFCVLFGAGALGGPAAVTLAWVILGGLVTGLAYELPVRAAESGIARRERFTGVSIPAFLTAKAALLFPALALADLVTLAIPASTNRLQAGFGISYLVVFIASLVGLSAAALFPGPPECR